MFLPQLFIRMLPVSIVIITKNEADGIAACINAARSISNDILIIDNGSTDDTLPIALALGCTVYNEQWNGYGANKNKGIKQARYDWILSLDADEIPDPELVQALHEVDLTDNNVVFDIKFRSYFGKKLIRFGVWGRDHHVRLFNRQVAKWSAHNVHERLIVPKCIKTKSLSGFVHHYSVKDTDECYQKALYYARLSALKYFESGKKPNAFTLYMSPLFGFFVNYIILLGFLDGKSGWIIARSIFINKWRKYQYLNKLYSVDTKKQPGEAKLIVDY